MADSDKRQVSSRRTSPRGREAGMEWLTLEGLQSMIRDSVEEALRSAQERTTAASGPAGAAGTLATGKSPSGSTKLKRKLKRK